MNRLFAAGCVLGLGLLIPVYAEDDKGKGEKPNPAVKKLNRDIPRHKLFLKRIEENCREMLEELARFTSDLDERIR